MGTTIIYLRCTTSGAAGSSLGATMKYLRRTTSAAANNGMSTTIIHSVPQPQAAEQPFKPSAPPRRHRQRPQLVKGKSPQGSRVTVQIEQYFLYSAAQLTSCSSPTALASRLTSSILPRQPRRKPSWKPASTPPRSYGRRHLGITSHRRKPTVETCVDNTAKLRPQASVLARSLQACCHTSA